MAKYTTSMLRCCLLVVYLAVLHTEHTDKTDKDMFFMNVLKLAVTCQCQF